jgi:hypothetical protein
MGTRWANMLASPASYMSQQQQQQQQANLAGQLQQVRLKLAGQQPARMPARLDSSATGCYDEARRPLSSQFQPPAPECEASHRLTDTAVLAAASASPTRP